MKDVVGGAIVAVPVVNEMTNHGIITALKLDHAVWLGMTYGAWFKIGMGVALLLLIVERGLSVYLKIKLGIEHQLEDSKECDTVESTNADTNSIHHVHDKARSVRRCHKGYKTDKYK